MKSIGEGIFKLSGKCEIHGPFLYGVRVVGGLILFL